MLVEDHKLEAVISLPSGVFRPYAGVSTAILVFTKTGVGGTDHVWLYDMKADGLSLDDKRQPLLPAEKLGPLGELTDAEHDKNNLPDLLMRWEETSPWWPRRWPLFSIFRLTSIGRTLRCQCLRRCGSGYAPSSS
jgi:type I restriction-modification system DNA methylase subunit